MRLLQFQEDAYIVTTSNHELYDGIPLTSPITLTGSLPSGAFLCRVTVASATGHTDCAGSVTVGSETLTFTASGQKKLTTVLLSALPTVTFSGLDCNILIEVVDSNGANIVSEIATATKVQFENTTSGYFNQDGQWTAYSGSYALCRDAAIVGNVLRYNSTDLPIKKVDVERYFNKIIYYIFYL